MPQSKETLSFLDYNLVFPPYVIVNYLRETEHRAWRNLTAALRRPIHVEQPDNPSHIVVASSSETKLRGSGHMFNQRLERNLPLVRELPPAYQEPRSSDVERVAKHKAEVMRRMLNIRTPVVGTDTAFAQWNPQKGWEYRLRFAPDNEYQSHLSEDNIAHEIQRLKNQYVHQQSLRLRWDIAMAVCNGFTSVATVSILVEAQPFTSEEFQTMIEHALETGMFFSSNAGVALIEHLIIGGKIKRIGFIPAEFWSQEHSPIETRNWMQEPSLSGLRVALWAIKNSVPSPIVGMRNISPGSYQNRMLQHIDK